MLRRVHRRQWERYRRLDGVRTVTDTGALMETIPASAARKPESTQQAVGTFAELIPETCGLLIPAGTVYRTPECGTCQNYVQYDVKNEATTIKLTGNPPTVADPRAITPFGNPPSSEIP